MNIYNLTIIGISLAMDAFSVTLSIGINKNVKKNKIIIYILFFSFFQFLFMFLGGSCGYYFNKYISALPSLAGGIVMILIGSIMIVDGFKKKDETILLKTSMALILGISVSIDALIIGFTSFYNINNIMLLFIDSIYIGLITLFMCTLASFMCHMFKKIDYIAKYSTFIGGIALISFGIKMIIK